jgi:HK97 family phage prohead protease
MANNLPQREQRAFATEIRVDRSGEKPKIVGYAARFNELSSPLGWGGWFVEKITPGAFTKALESSDIRALFNHDSNKVLGRSSAGTLRVFEDEAGLRYEITPPSAQWVEDLLISLERGDIRESSFQFEIESDEWDESQEPWQRTITAVKRLWDVGPVTFPAYPTATAGLRSAEEVYETRKKERETNVENQQESTARAEIFRRRLALAEKE